MAGDAFFGGKSDKSEPSTGSGDSEKVEAAQDVLDAIADRDAKALNLALERHYELCSGELDADDGVTSEED